MTFCYAYLSVDIALYKAVDLCLAEPKGSGNTFCAGLPNVFCQQPADACAFIDLNKISFCVGGLVAGDVPQGDAAGIDTGAANTFLASIVPLYDIGFGWITPCFGGILLGFVWKACSPKEAE
jgi:hypothetical protein